MIRPAPPATRRSAHTASFPAGSRPGLERWANRTSQRHPAACTRLRLALGADLGRRLRATVSAHQAPREQRSDEGRGVWHVARRNDARRFRSAAVHHPTTPPISNPPAAAPATFSAAAANAFIRQRDQRRNHHHQQRASATRWQQHANRLRYEQTPRRDGRGNEPRL